MKKILLLGAGKIGAIISEFLLSSGDYELTLADSSAESLARISDREGLQKLLLDVSNKVALEAALSGQFATLSALPFDITARVAEVATQCGVHYLDLTEDVESTQQVQKLASTANSALIPQCGLAPGFITIAAFDLAKHFDELRDVHMRVGALPKYPSNAMKYNLTWSTDGLINEYCNPCQAIVEGELRHVLPLEELETFALDGISYEAFNTSGGLGTLCDTLNGKVNNLNYRSVRYPGHRDIMKMLLLDLRLRDRRALLKEILEHALPITYQDVVLVFINVSGIKNGQLVQETYANKIYSQTINGKLWSAIQVTTASGICTVLDLLAQSKLPQKGFIRQEDICFKDFMDNRFGRYYLAKDEQPQSQAEGKSNRAA